MAAVSNANSLVLLPAVDVADGTAVRLVQGKLGSQTAYGAPLDAALLWQDSGAEWVHLVDLDAAFGRGSNRDVIARSSVVLISQSSSRAVSGTTTRSLQRSPPAALGSTSERPHSSSLIGCVGR